jgi:predicted metal-dependent HD superfamily phosphohydrolase
LTQLDRWWPLPAAAALRDELAAAYADPRRGYHDTRHLTEVLQRIDELLDADDLGVDRTTVRLAAWFHDGVYDGRPGAEERSAQWAEQSLPAVGVTPDRVAEVTRLVRMTEHHRPAEDDHSGAVLSDADLGILAADPQRYADYTSAVRREYAHVPDRAFAEGRSAILRDLLAQATLFHTAYAREHWEAPARANVTAELERLSSGVS